MNYVPIVVATDLEVHFSVLKNTFGNIETLLYIHPMQQSNRELLKSAHNILGLFHMVIMLKVALLHNDFLIHNLLKTFEFFGYAMLEAACRFHDGTRLSCCF